MTKSKQNNRDQIIKEDLYDLYQRQIAWERLKNRRILITGATGMLATFLTRMLIFLNDEHGLGIRVYLLARNRDKLLQRFGDETEHVRFLVQDVCEKIDAGDHLDWIFHAAGAASTHSILNDPVGIIRANTIGTLNVMELARTAGKPKILFTSTREIYGKVKGVDRISETDMGITDPLVVRSCYPESKRMAESILASYRVQYGIPFNSLRIAHVYGPAMQISNDGRVMADFINDAIQNRDITLKSDGKAVRAFIYITDAVDAIFRVMMHGNHKGAYNIANESEPLSIFDIAGMVQSLAGNEKKVFVNRGSTQVQGYTNYKRIPLDTTRIRELGWHPEVSLRDGISRTLQYFKTTD